MAMLACLATSAAWAAPMPPEVLGTWTDQPTCGKAARKMVFAATTVTVIQDDGRRKSVQVDTTGTASERLEVRVTKVLSGEAEDPAGAHVGDVIVMRREKDVVHLIGHGDATNAVQDDPNGPVLHRCKG
jgi:hypothetical protein